MKFFASLFFSIFLICFLITSPLFAVEGFKVFEFGDNHSEVQEAGNKYCRFSELLHDSRWAWKSYINCKGYRYKGTKTQIFFEFVEDELVKITVVSKVIPNYFLIRSPKLIIKTPKDRKKRKKQVNLADELMLEDKVHVFDQTRKLVYFFYQKKWEWELSFFNPKYHKHAKQREEKQLKSEVEQGLAEWKGFAFEDPLQMTKEKLEGLCSSTKTLPLGSKQKILQCFDFSFSGEEVRVEFLFTELTLQRIEVLLGKKWYAKLLEPLKKKYGTPYRELGENPIYYPYLHFPKKNILLAHRYSKKKKEPLIVFLRYIKEGYEKPAENSVKKDKKEPKMDQKKSKKSDINLEDL